MFTNANSRTENTAGRSPERVVVAMSGGVDSSVAAALLVQQGYEVVGMMMRLWSEPNCGDGPSHNRCCTPDQMADARRVADHLNIPFYVIDVQEHFRRRIVQFFIDEYAAGRTPNPCIECNREIRFTHLLQRALSLEARYLATGHYARIRRSNGDYQLLMAVDENKDQSYVLHVLGQKELAHVLFPVGDYTKEEVRQLAGDFGLPIAQKSESMDLCFLGDGDYRRFLQEHAPEVHRPGPILDQAGAELGRHQGLAFYTIGQRKGLGLTAPEPLYVLGKEIERNALIVGARAELGRQTLTAREVNWIAGHPPDNLIQADVKIRYKARPAPARIEVLAQDRARVRFDQPVAGITAGQGAVFYQGARCLGGGIISGQETANGTPGQEKEPARLISPAHIPVQETA